MGAPVTQKSGAQVVEGVDVVRIPLEVELEMLDGAGKVAERRMRARDVHMDPLVVGSKRQHALEFGLRQPEISLRREIGPEVAATDGTGRVGLERVPPQGVCIAPDLDLLSAQVGEAAEPHYAEAGERPGERRAERACSSRPDDGARGGDDDEREAESGEIAVPVVRQLVSGMNDSDHRAQ